MSSSRDVADATRDKQKAFTNAAASGAVSLDCALYNRFDLTLAGNTTLTLVNPPSLSGETFAVYVSVSNGSTAYTLTHAASTPITTGNAAPQSPAANKRKDFVYETKNGTAWDLFEGPST